MLFLICSRWGLTWVKLEHAFNQRAAAHRLEWLAFIVQLGQQQKKAGRSIKSANMSKKDKRGTESLTSMISNVKSGCLTWGDDGKPVVSDFADQPLTLADFDDYVLGVGRTSRTWRFTVLEMRLNIQQQDQPKVILRRFMIDSEETAEAALHAHTKVPVEILKQMKTVAATYGYLGAQADVQRWQAHAQIDSPEQLLKLLSV